MTAERQPLTRAVHGRHDPDMNLPQGMTCVNCVNFRRCNLLFGHIETDEVCDWAPSRFVAIAAAAAAEVRDERTVLERRQDEIDESRATEASEWEARDRFIEGYDA